jgi:hypothetical protein
MWKVRRVRRWARRKKKIEKTERGGENAANNTINNK